MDNIRFNHIKIAVVVAYKNYIEALAQKDFQSPREGKSSVGRAKRDFKLAENIFLNALKHRDVKTGCQVAIFWFACSSFPLLEAGVALA